MFRVTTLNKVTELKEKNEKKRLQHVTEVNELKRQIAVERQLHEFIDTRCRERTGLEEAQLRHGESSKILAPLVKKLFQGLVKSVIGNMREI